MRVEWLFSVPLLVVWTVGLLLGVRLLRLSRQAGVCLALASLIELARILVALVAFPVVASLWGGRLEHVEGLATLRLVVGMLAVALSHGLLLAAMFGWRVPAGTLRRLAEE